jgi:hypothetical protein
MNPKIPIAAITDEFSPDLETALHVMQEIGMSAAELRVIWGKNIMDLSDDELERVREITTAMGFKVISIASPLLKCCPIRRRLTAGSSTTSLRRSIRSKTSPGWRNGRS